MVVVVTCVVLLHAGAATVIAFAAVVDNGGDSDFLKALQENWIQNLFYFLQLLLKYPSKKKFCSKTCCMDINV